VRKLAEVEEAKTLMLEAADWSTFTWLWEKRRVRETADRANDALDRLNRAMKARWTSDVKAAYKEISAKARASAAHNSSGNGATVPEVLAYVKKVKTADEAAHHARITAEGTFDEAERRMSTELAREGCRQAIHSWELHEKAIRCAEAAPGPEKNGA
jgi:hypothetical protein